MSANLVQPGTKSGEVNPNLLHADFILQKDSVKKRSRMISSFVWSCSHRFIIVIEQSGAARCPGSTGKGTFTVHEINYSEEVRRFGGKIVERETNIVKTDPEDQFTNSRC